MTSLDPGLRHFFSQASESAHGSSSSGASGILLGETPLDNPVTLLIIQLFIIIGISRAIFWLVRFLRQPRVVAEIIGGVVLGPSALGRIPKFLDLFFPSHSMPILSTVANIGLIFFLFLVGLELDPASLKQTGRQAALIAGAGMLFPFALGIPASYVIFSIIGDSEVPFGTFLLFMGVAMCITAFPVLARILSEMKLITTEIGQMTMSAAAVNDVVAWILLALTIALLNAGTSPLNALYIFIMAAAFVLFMFMVVRRVVFVAVQRISGFDHVSDGVVLMTFLLVLGAAVITDMIGIHAIFGAFVAGLIFPKDCGFTHQMTLRVEDLVIHLLLPCYFAISGIRTQIGMIDSGETVGLTLMIIAVACVGKIGGSFVVARGCGIPYRPALTLSFLMNTKGLVELIVLNIGLSSGVINVRIFTMCVLMALVTTFMTTPLVSLVHRGQGPGISEAVTAPKKKRKIPNQLRVMIAMSNMRSVPILLSFLDYVMPTSPQNLKIFSGRIMELSERPSSFLYLNERSHRSKLTYDPPTMAVRNYGNQHRVATRPKLILSSTRDAHFDICRIAAKKDCDVIVLPYHVTDTLVSVLLEGTDINQVSGELLNHAPCSVVVAVELPNSNSMAVDSRDRDNDDAGFDPDGGLHLLLIFMGGPDDREALAIADRISRNRPVQVTIVLLWPSANRPFDDNISLDAKDPPSLIGVSQAMGDGHVVSADLPEEFATRFWGMDPLDRRSLETFFETYHRKTTLWTVAVEDDPVAKAAQVVGSFTTRFDVVLVGRSLRCPPSCFADFYQKNPDTPLTSTSTNSRKAILGRTGDVVVCLAEGEQRFNPLAVLVVQAGGAAPLYARPAEPTNPTSLARRPGTAHDADAANEEESRLVVGSKPRTSSDICLAAEDGGESVDAAVRSPAFDSSERKPAKHANAVEEIDEPDAAATTTTVFSSTTQLSLPPPTAAPNTSSANQSFRSPISYDEQLHNLSFGRAGAGISTHSFVLRAVASPVRPSPRRQRGTSEIGPIATTASLPLPSAMNLTNRIHRSSDPRVSSPKRAHPRK